MSKDRDTPISCLDCARACQPVLTGLVDNRYGAPGEYHVVKCTKCGLEQTWPRHTEAELKRLYEEYYNWGGEGNTIYQRFRERFLTSGLYRLWLRWDGDICFHLKEGKGMLLDVGCNEGRGLSLYAANGFQAEGLELNERAAALARKRGFNVYTMPLAQFTPKRPYEVVVLSHVLEHTVDPVAMLIQMRRILQPQGQICISCPNASSFWRQVFGRHWVHWHVPFHVCHFSPQTLSNILSKAGFQLVTMRTFTPSLWIAQSLCTMLGTRGKGAKSWMRSAPVIGLLMLAARGIILPWLNHTKEMNGDCLVVMAVPQS